MDDAITKSSTGLEGNVAGALTYALGWVTGVIFLLIEKDSKFVRFHAMQSILTFVAITVIQWILAFAHLGILTLIVWLLSVGLWIFLIIQAYQGKLFKLPVVGDIAAKQMDR
jgi:uncharacterized membrane protein